MEGCVYCHDTPGVRENCYCREIKPIEGVKLGELQVIVAKPNSGKSIFLEELLEGKE